MMPKKSISIILLFFAGLSILSLASCAPHDKGLIVYAGKGLKAAVEDIVHSFEQKHDIAVNVVYAGSQTLLTVIKKTQKGDIFIPGSLGYVERAGDLVASSQIVAEHRTMIFVRKDNPKEITALEDLSKAGIRLAIGNKKIAAIGHSTEKMFERTGNQDDYLKNITMLASTANELLDLVIQEEVDAVITHAHLLHLTQSKTLRAIAIPDSLAQPLQIPLAVLSVSENRRTANLFSNFVATEGRLIFKKHGFGD